MRYAIDPRFRAIPGTSSPLELRAMVQNPFAFFEERYLKHGPIFRSSLVYPVVWMMGAEANRTIMVSGRENFSYAGRLRSARVREAVPAEHPAARR
jgi:hypothetical protein